MKKLIKWSFLILIGIFLFFFWFGFWFPNPTMRSWTIWSADKLLYLWLPRIFVPLFYGLIVFLFLTRDKKLKQNLGTLLGAVCIISFITLPILYYFRAISSKRSAMKLYHSFLQIKPPQTDTLDYHYSRDDIKIFCLGGSTTEFKNNRGVGWTELLEQELRHTYNTDSIYVFNFGRQWYTSLHSLINYETNLRQYKPDVIIYMHNINDLLCNADFSYLSIGPFRQDYGHFLGPAVNIFNSKYTGIFGRGRTKFRTIWYYNYPKRTILEEYILPGLEPFKRNINSLIDLASLDSTKVILLSEPNILSENMDVQIREACVMVNYEAVGKDKKWGYSTVYLGMKKYNQSIEDISENRKVYFIDLEKQIPKSLIYFKDEVHYNDTTFNIISKKLAEEIIKLGIISR